MGSKLPETVPSLLQLAVVILDPTMVTRSALENAASIAAMFLTTEAIITEKPEPKTSPAGDPTGGMGGMM